MVVGINSRELKALVAVGYPLDFRESGIWSSMYKRVIASIKPL